MPAPRGVLSDEVRERCVQALRGCSYVKDACAYAGIVERRYHEWVARGLQYNEHLEAGGEIIDGEDQYRIFALEVDLARAEARVSASMEIRKAFMAGDWRAAIAFLERSDPQHWGKVARIEMTGREGGPIEVDVTAMERRLAESIRSRPLVIDAETIVDETVGRALPAAASIAAADDDTDDYWVVPYADGDYSFDDGGLV